MRAGIALGLLLQFPVLGGKACAAFDQQPVKIFNDASLEHALVASAQSEAAILLRAVCVQVVWVHCQVVDFSRREPCLAPDSAFEVHILRRPRSGGDSDNALGTAFPTLGSNGNAAVFFSRVRETVASNPGAIELPTLLGHVIAHEIGHLLMRSSAHSSEGLMRAQLRPSDLRKAARRQLNFTREQQQKIRRNLLAKQPAQRILD